MEDLCGNQLADEEIATSEADDRGTQITGSTSLLTPAKRAALEALEREFQDLLRRS